MGYDKDTDSYEIGGSEDITFNINNVDRITATQFVTSESIVHTSSGSTSFGNSSDDLHTFTGSISASGDIKLGPGTSLMGIQSGGNIYLDTTGGGGKLYHASDQSHFFSFDNDTSMVYGDSIRFRAIDGNITFQGGTTTKMRMTSSNGHFGLGVGIPGTEIEERLTIGLGGVDDGNILCMGNFYNEGSASIGTKQTSSNAHLTVQGNISASGDIFLEANGRIQFADASTYIQGNSTQLLFDGDDKFNVRADTSAVFDTPLVGINMATTVTPPKTLTVEGDISASGTLFVSNSHATKILSVGTAGSTGGGWLDLGTVVEFGQGLQHLTQSKYTDLSATERNITIESSDPTIRIAAISGDRTPKLDFVRGDYEFSGADNYTDYRFLNSGGHFYFKNKRSGYEGGDTQNVWSINANNLSMLIGSASSPGGTPLTIAQNLTTSSLEVQGEIRANELITGKQYQTYFVGFNSDPGVNETSVPWGSTYEQTNLFDEMVGFLIPCKTNIKHVLLRSQGFDQNLSGTPTITWRVKKHTPYGTAITDEANWETMETTTTILDTSADTGAKQLIYAKFSGSHCNGGDILSVSFQFSADFTNGTDEFYATVVAEHDYNTLPNVSDSTGSLYTGSAYFGWRD
jgi:hypothetical protein